MTVPTVRPDTRTRLRLPGVMSTVSIVNQLTDPAWKSYDVGDLDVTLQPIARNSTLGELRQEVASAAEEFQHYSDVVELLPSDEFVFQNDDYYALRGAQHRLVDAALRLLEEGPSSI